MIYLPAVIGMVLLHGLFVATEYAFVKAASSYSQSVAGANRYKANEEIILNIEDYLQVCQIGKTIALMLTGVCLGLALNHAAGSISLLGLGFLVVVLVHMVIGFELPKQLAIVKNDLCIDWLAGFLRVSLLLLMPMAWLVKQLTQSD